MLLSFINIFPLKIRYVLLPIRTCYCSHTYIAMGCFKMRLEQSEQFAWTCISNLRGLIGANCSDCSNHAPCLRSLMMPTLMAFRTLLRLVRIVLRRRLNRTISCTSTVFMLCLYDVGYFRSATSVLKSPGSLARMSAATSSTTSSLDFPLPEDALA